MKRIAPCIAAFGLLSTQSAYALAGGTGGGDDDKKGYEDPRAAPVPAPVPAPAPVEAAPEPAPAPTPVREADPVRAVEPEPREAPAPRATSECGAFWIGCRPDRNYQFRAGVQGTWWPGHTNVQAINNEFNILGDVQAQSAAGPFVDFTYFITDRFAIEAGGTWTHHNVTADDTPIDLGDVNFAGLSLMGQYRLLRGRWQPYVGAGILFGIFHKENQNELGAEFDNGIGPNFQAGVDYYFTEAFVGNFAISHSRMKVDLSLAEPFMGSETIDVHPVQMKLGFGYRF